MLNTLITKLVESKGMTLVPVTGEPDKQGWFYWLDLNGNASPEIFPSRFKCALNVLNH